jgi:DNA-binding transcriptional MerR regulator
MRGRSQGSQAAVEKAPDAFRTISEVAGELDVPQHVLRFWESRFREIKPLKRGGGRRYYRPDDVALLRGIRHLLYGEGYTIRGVQRILREHSVRFVQTVWQPGAPQPARGRGEDGETSQEIDGQSLEAVEPDRGRKLLNLLPSLLADDELRTEPAEAREPRGVPGQRIAPPLPSRIGVPREDLRKLRAALNELEECRRLLDAGLGAS